MATNSGWVCWEKVLDVELDRDLLLSSPFVRILEQEKDGEHTGEQGAAEPADPAGEDALLGLGLSKSAPYSHTCQLVA